MRCEMIVGHTTEHITDSAGFLVDIVPGDGLECGKPATHHCPKLDVKLCSGCAGEWEAQALDPIELLPAEAA